MNNKFISLLVLAGLSFQAQADPTLSFDPDSQTTGVGNSVSVDLVISDLGPDDLTTVFLIEGILSTFDLFITYDDTILQFDGFEFGSDCGGFSCLDVLGFDANLEDVFDWGLGEIEVFELSFDWDPDLDFFQPDEFVLGTFTFTGLQFGVSALNISGLMGGGYDEDPASDTFGFVQELAFNVEAGSIEVPEPATLLLFMGGLLGMGMRQRNQAVRA